MLVDVFNAVRADLIVAEPQRFQILPRMLDQISDVSIIEPTFAHTENFQVGPLSLDQLLDSSVSNMVAG